MANQLDKLSAGVTNKGIDSHNQGMDTELRLTKTSKNIMSGINQGIGPRYGMSPIPGQSNLDLESAANSKGLRASEAAGTEADAFVDRVKFLGIVPVSIGSYDDLTSKGRMFVWLLSDFEDNTNHLINAVASGSFTDGGANPNTFKYQFDIGYGLINNHWQAVNQNGTTKRATLWLSPIMSRVRGPFETTDSAETFFRSKLTLPSDLQWLSTALFSVSGKKFPQQWLIGTKVANGDATNTATANFIGGDVAGGSDTPSLYGVSPSWNLGNWKKSTRSLVFYNLAVADLEQTYIYDIEVDDSTFVATFNQDETTSNYSLSGAADTTVANFRGDALSTASVDKVLLNDPEGQCDSAHRAILAAGKKPYAYVMQEWQRDYEGRNIQMVDLTNRRVKPITHQTLDSRGATSSGFYEENNTPVRSCFQAWPNFDTGALALNASRNASSNNFITRNAANTGILRANTTYEFTVAFFDKQLGVESNVGKPVKFSTSTDDFVSITLYRDSEASAGTWLEEVPASIYSQSSGARSLTLAEEFMGTYDGVSDTYIAGHLNYLELRFYYRALGSFEWLPALFIDAAKFFYFPGFQEGLNACEGNVAGLPGGQPGGFIDHSELPEDEYFCVVNYKGRAFWFSDKNMAYSLQNNVFEYPLRNSVPAPTAGWRGAITHTFRGDSSQEERMVIFGGEEAYIGRFTGNKLTQPVVVSPDTVANYEVDGSDFVVETWTSVTAFSHRAAVVADGDLFWWGEQGVYYDNGIGNPKKISKRLEPDIFDYYDPSKIDEIHAVYDSHTKEIIWFYPPKSDNTITHGLVYNTETDEFFPQEWGCKIDWAKRVNTANTDVTQDTNNLRTIVSARKDSSETVQRGYFLDRLNRSGDMRPETELLVKEVAVGSQSDYRVLTLDSGYDATNFATIAADDLIAVHQFQQYTGESTGDDMLAKVVSTDAVNDQITIRIPDGATLPAVNISDHRKYCPIWHAAANGAGLNGISWEIDSKYWLLDTPNYNGILQWLYCFFKYDKWKRIDNNTFEIAYRTPVSESTISDTIEMLNNSDGHFQVYHAFREGELNNQGQAIKLNFSGVHIGDKWVLQYLEIHAQDEGGDLLRQFQG